MGIFPELFQPFKPQNLEFRFYTAGRIIWKLQNDPKIFIGKDVAYLLKWAFQFVIAGALLSIVLMSAGEVRGGKGFWFFAILSG